MNAKLLAFLTGAACLLAAAVPGLAQAPPAPAPEATTPVAAAPETPDWAWGVWATPSCDAPEVVSFGTDQIVVARDREGRVWAFEKEAFVQAGEWVRVRYGSGLQRQVQLARQQGEDRLQVADHVGATPPSDTDLAAGLATPAAPDWRLTEYQRCPYLPGEAALVHAEAAAVLASTREVQAACAAGGGDEASCGDAVLRAVDVSGDGLLGVAEVARVLRVAGYLAGVASGLERGQPTTEKELAAWLAGGLFAGPALGELLVKSLDYDADGRLSPAELAQDRAGGLGGLAGRLDVGAGQARLGRAFGQVRDLALQIISKAPPRPR